MSLSSDRLFLFCYIRLAMQNKLGCDSMSINMETAIANMYALKAKGIRYSMNYGRIGEDGTGDCSGTVYNSLRKAGATNAGWVLNTDSMHSWLVTNGFKLIAQNQDWTAKRGDIVIFGLKGASGGDVKDSLVA